MEQTQTLYEVSVVNNNVVITNQEEFVELVKKAKELTEQVDSIKEQVKALMQENGIVTFENEFIKAQIIQKKDSEDFNKALFKSENYELYAKYTKMKKNTPMFKLEVK